MKLPGRSLNAALSTPDRQVTLIETVPCSSGDCFVVTFESAETRWRQGVWLAIDGVLVVEHQAASQVVLWKDTAPEQVRIDVGSTNDGLLRFYNVWDSGRGLGTESQSHTSGMVREMDSGDVRYRCSDINPEPTFKALVFRIGQVS